MKDLEAQFVALLQMLDRVEAGLRTPGAAGTDALRASLAAAVAEHFAAKEELYETWRLIAGHELEPVLRRSRARTLGVVVAYRFHLNDWRSAAVAADPAGYREAATGLIARVRALVAADRETLLPALARLADPAAVA